MSERDAAEAEKENTLLRRELSKAEEALVDLKGELHEARSALDAHMNRQREYEIDNQPLFSNHNNNKSSSKHKQQRSHSKSNHHRHHRNHHEDDEMSSEGSGPPSTPRRHRRDGGQSIATTAAASTAAVESLRVATLELERLRADFAKEREVLESEGLAHRRRGLQAVQDYQLFVELEEARERVTIHDCYDRHTNSLLRSHQAVLESMSKLQAKERARCNEHIQAWKNTYKRHASEQEDLLAERMRIAAATYETYYLVPIVRNALSPPVTRILQQRIKRIKADHEVSVQEWRDAFQYFHSIVDRHWRAAHSLLMTYEHQVTSLFVEQVVDVYKELGYDNMPAIMQGIRDTHSSQSRGGGVAGMVQSRDSTPMRQQNYQPNNIPLAPPMPAPPTYLSNTAVTGSSPAPLPTLNADRDNLMYMGGGGTALSPIAMQQQQQQYHQHHGGSGGVFNDGGTSALRHAERTAAAQREEAAAGNNTSGSRLLFPGNNRPLSIDPNHHSFSPLGPQTPPRYQQVAHPGGYHAPTPTAHLTHSLQKQIDYLNRQLQIRDQQHQQQHGDSNAAASTSQQHQHQQPSHDYDDHHHNHHHLPIEYDMGAFAFEPILLSHEYMGTVLLDHLDGMRVEFQREVSERLRREERQVYIRNIAEARVAGSAMVSSSSAGTAAIHSSGGTAAHPKFHFDEVTAAAAPMGSVPTDYRTTASSSMVAERALHLYLLAAGVNEAVWVGKVSSLAQQQHQQQQPSSVDQQNQGPPPDSVPLSKINSIATTARSPSVTSIASSSVLRPSATNATSSLSADSLGHISTPGAKGLANLFVDMQVQRASEMLGEHAFVLSLATTHLSALFTQHHQHYQGNRYNTTGIHSASRGASPFGVRGGGGGGGVRQHFSGLIKEESFSGINTTTNTTSRPPLFTPVPITHHATPIHRQTTSPLRSYGGGGIMNNDNNSSSLVSMFEPAGPLSPHSKSDFLRGVAQEGASAVLETQRDQAVIVSRWLTSEMQSATDSLKKLLFNNTKDKLKGQHPTVRQEPGTSVYANRNVISPDGPIGTPAGGLGGLSEMAMMGGRIVRSGGGSDGEDSSFGEADGVVLTPPRRHDSSPYRGSVFSPVYSPTKRTRASSPTTVQLLNTTATTTDHSNNTNEYLFDYAQHCLFMTSALKEVGASLEQARQRNDTLEEALHGYEEHIEECHATMATMRASHTAEKDIYEDTVGFLVRQIRDERHGFQELFAACRREIVRIGISGIEWRDLASEYKASCEEVLGVWRAMGAITDASSTVWSKDGSYAATAAAATNAAMMDVNSDDERRMSLVGGEGEEDDDEDVDDSLRLTYPEGISYKSRRKAQQMRQRLNADDNSSYFTSGRSIAPRSNIRGAMSTISMTPTTAAQLKKEAELEAKALVGADSAIHQHMAMGNALLFAHNAIVETLCEGCVAAEEMEMVAGTSDPSSRGKGASRAFGARGSRLANLRGSVQGRLEVSERIDAMLTGEYAVAAMEEAVVYSSSVFYEYFANLRESWIIAHDRCTLAVQARDVQQVRASTLAEEVLESKSREEGLKKDCTEQSQRCELLTQQVHDLNRQTWMLRNEVASMHAKLDLKKAHIADIEEQLELIETATGAEMEAKKLAILGIRDLAGNHRTDWSPPRREATTTTGITGTPTTDMSSLDHWVARTTSRPASPKPVVNFAADFGFDDMMLGSATHRTTSKTSPRRLQTPPRGDFNNSDGDGTGKRQSPKRSLYNTYLRSDSSPYSRD